jgi:DnaJ-class molecular chaperone
MADYFGAFRRAMQPTGAKRAGDTIPCLKCHGAGYTKESLTSDYPVECNRCQGAGKQTVRPS